jgi:hypothetical protein
MINQQEYLAELYVELTTRKLALDFNEETDCIYEVYNSWFKFFGWCREQMKKIAREDGSMFYRDYNNEAYKFYKYAMEIMRPHIERYSYDFRSYWENYAVAEGENVWTLGKPYKDHQCGYRFYKEIVADIKSINKKYQEMTQEIIKEINNG